MKPLRRTLAVCSLLILALASWGCRRDAPPPTPQGAAQEKTAADAAELATVEGEVRHYDVSGAPVADGIFIGSPKRFGALTIYPVLAKTQVDVGPLMSLDEALAKEKAEVREKGGTPNVAQQQQRLNDEAPVQQRSNEDAPIDPPPQLANVQQVGGGASVGTLVIENKGDIPVYVLAGTIVKGGKQDRQIGQDFIIGARQVVPIDAFCVEHGRWNGIREGKSTDGKFTTIKQLANAEVRVAGQYKGNQSEVWSKVSKVNKANKKRSQSDSLLATADDAELKKQRDALAKQVLTHLDGVNPSAAVVGYGYAIGDQVKGVRWFAHHRVFGMFREALVNTAVVDAVTAQNEGQVAGDSPAPVRVAKFVTEARNVRERQTKDTAADNKNEYVESEEAYGSTTVLKSKKRRPGKPAPKPVKMSEDFAAKK